MGWRIDIAYAREGALCVAAQAATVLYTESRPGRFLSFSRHDQAATSILVAVRPHDIRQLLTDEEPIFLLRGAKDLVQTSTLTRCELP